MSNPSTPHIATHYPDLGQDEMGRRGCPERSHLDLDLKARHLSTEELMHALGAHMQPNGIQSLASKPFLEYAPWWDKSCDIGLVVGTFIHGLGNYEAMRHDEDLPFINRIKYYVNECDATEAESFRRIDQSAHAVRKVFDNNLDTLRAKFHQQTTAAVAAVIASSKSDAPASKTGYVLQKQKLDDDDVITVPRLKLAAVKAFRKPCDPLSNTPVVSDRAGKGPGGRELSVPYCPLPLPDSKHLDHLLLRVVNSIEESKIRGEASNGISRRDQVSLTSNESLWRQDIQTHLDRSLFDGCIMTLDKKKPPDNDSDYFNGAVSKELANVAVGADSSRYERGACVPMVITRFGLGAVLHADDSVIDVVSKTPLKKPKKEIVVESDKSISNETNDSESPKTTDPSPEQNTDNSSEIAKAETPVPQNLPAWQYILDDTQLRASLCASIMFAGYPYSNESYVKASADLLDEIKSHPSLAFLLVATKNNFFSLQDVVGQGLDTAGLDWSEKKESVEQYFQSVLFPHCLRLCLMLAGELNKKSTKQGPSSLNDLNSIPDPCLPIECHSEEAMTRAFGILRRAKLMKALRFIVGGGVRFSSVKSVLHGPLLRNLSFDVPVWWCPWIHDFGLLVHAAFYGLESTVTELPGLQRPYVEQHIREVFIEGKNACLPRCFLDKATPDELTAWVQAHAEQFPTPVVIERRLALLCSELTKGTEVQYDNVPMYDGGGWPSATSSSGFIGDTRAAGSGSCLLVDLERRE
jgi:hypothetical protein